MCVLDQVRIDLKKHLICIQKCAMVMKYHLHGMWQIVVADGGGEIACLNADNDNNNGVNKWHFNAFRPGIPI